MREADRLALKALENRTLWVEPEAGSVWRQSTGRRAEQLHVKSGYGRVQVQRTPRLIYAMAHRIVWLATHGPIPDGLQINHRNGLRWDNRIENLELVTGSGNVRHGLGYGYAALDPDDLDGTDLATRLRHEAASQPPSPYARPAGRRRAFTGR